MAEVSENDSTCNDETKQMYLTLHMFLSPEDSVSSGNGKKRKVLIGVVLVAIAGVAAFLLAPKKSSLGDAVKTAGLNVTSSGKLKLFDPQSESEQLVFRMSLAW